jgi:signal transduction histidine kinase
MTNNLAETRGSLRRLAGMVAEGARPDAVFTAVAQEVLRHFGGSTVCLTRYETDGTLTLLASEGIWRPHVHMGQAWRNHPRNGLAAAIRRTGRATRIEYYGALVDGDPDRRKGLRSVVGIPIRIHGRLWGSIAVGSGSSELAIDIEQQLTEFTELIAIAIANAQSRTELLASRARIVAASDEACRRIERDLHDGAQQRLVGLALRLRMTADAAPDNAPIRREIETLVDEVVGVIHDLREISRGIHPSVLFEAGLGAAMRMLARRSTVPVQMEIRVEGRLPRPVETCAYYAVSEMLTNTAKHANASLAKVHAAIDGHNLRICVSDDGLGGADQARGSGLTGIRDRVEALGGTLSVTSDSDSGTRACIELPTETVN